MTEATEGHNSAARADLIRGTIRALDDIDSQIRVLQEQRTAIKNKNIKADLGMKVADFNVLRRFYGLQQEDRDTLFDTIREGFAALGIGDQASFLPALDEETPAPAKPKRGRKAKAKANGHGTDPAAAHDGDGAEADEDADPADEQRPDTGEGAAPQPEDEWEGARA